MKRLPGFVVAIDGPAGSGKSTTARLVAAKLGFRHLDTGAMYRAVALKVVETGTSLRDRAALARVLRRTTVRVEWPQGRLSRPDDVCGRVLLDGHEVTQAIRRPEVSALVSDVAALPMVRRKMVREQRRAARGQRIVCEGRDIGSVVFPRAQLKVYLDCDIAERAKRREKELRELGARQAWRSVRQGLVRRDRIDSTRRMSPLKMARDALLVDTTDLTIEEQVGVVCDLALRRGAPVHNE
ncbi:MAG: (d)CMP kinase [candidate division WOR-3 bacterium]